MQKLWRNFATLIVILSICSLGNVFAYPGELGDDFYLDKSKVLVQQIDLLQNRVAQAQKELKHLQQVQDTQLVNLSFDKVNKSWLKWTKIDISVASSNVDSIAIELSEAQQTITLLEKDIQEIENQLNVVNVFGVNGAGTGVPNSKTLKSQLAYQKDVLHLEKNRLVYLNQLQSIAEDTLQLYNIRYAKIENLLKSQTMLQLKEKQAKSEIDYQQQQQKWQQQLNTFYTKLYQLESTKSKDKAAYEKIMNEIFYANENSSFMYLQMLILRYKSQIQQFKASISHSSSIALLNKVSDQTQALNKQFVKLNELLSNRVEIINNRKAFLAQQGIEDNVFVAELSDLEEQYKASIQNVADLNDEIATFRTTLEQSLQQELSARQGLLGFGAKAWLDVGNEIVLLPTLTYQVFKSLIQAALKLLSHFNVLNWTILALIEMLWIAMFFYLNRFLERFILGVPDHELGHINPKWLGIQLFHSVLIDVAIIGNLYWFLTLTRIPPQHYCFLLNLGYVWLFFKAILTLARLCLVETVHDRAGHDVRLYHRLKWTVLIGGVITACTVFLHQLPLIYEMKDLFYRLFLIFVAVVSLLLLKSWDVLPSLILHYIDDRRTYFRKAIRLLGLLIPLILLVNSVIGVFGFINFVLTVSWYESVFLLVLIGYLIVRGVFSEVMEFFSHLFIRHVSNGWLWTEAFLKPLDKILRLVLFFTAWVVLFFFYGWDMQSPVVDRLQYIVHYHLFDLLNTSITMISIVEMVVIASILYWLGRWTREFMYRFLLSRTKDLGVRNSIAILTQYTMIVVGVLIGLRVLGIDLRALTVVAGAFAFGVGLGLRDLANNFACGFLLLLERPLRVGDTVTIAGSEGEVMHIGGRAVTVRTWDHMELLVPNAEIFGKSFTNWTAKDSIVRSIIAIKIRRHDNPLNVQALIYQTLANQPNVLISPAPEVLLKELADELIEFEVRYFVNLRQIKSRISVRSEVLFAIWQTFEKHGIQPPHPQHEVLIRGNLPLLNPVK